MLARVANNLFWMGRYIERAEHTARFLNVNYFSSLDAPNKLSQSRSFVLESMYAMVGEATDKNTPIEEDHVLFNMGLNVDKFYSVISCVRLARENANSSRDLISTEFYESINKLYHFINNYSAETYTKSGLYDFTTSVTESTSILRGKIRGTLLHDEVYSLIMLGINIERGIQITRIIKTKFDNAEKATGGYKNPVNSSYEWTTLLKCAESYDMMRRLYKKAPTQLNTLEFLILNPDCPRSVLNSLNQIFSHVKQLDALKIKDHNSAAFLVGKTRASYAFKTINDIEEDYKGFIENTLDCLLEMSARIQKEYFNY